MAPEPDRQHGDPAGDISVTLGEDFVAVVKRETQQRGCPGW